MTGDGPAGVRHARGRGTDGTKRVLPPGGAPWLAVLGALLTAVLAGCAGVPQEGPVTPAGPLAARSPQILFGAPPQHEESPEAVVRGFLQAGADFGKDHQVAREYLVPDSEWRPEAPVLVVADDSISVQEEATSGAPVTPPAPASSPTPGAGRSAPSGGSSRLEDGTTTRVRITATVLARVDLGGVYTSVTGEGAKKVVTLGLVARHGDWRITDPPDGLMLTTAVFRNGFRSAPLYFPDAGGTALVPDLRWFPVLAEPSATAALVIAALLGGPVEWLRNAVTTGAAPGTSMTALAPVRIEGSTMRVDLSRSARNATPPQRVLLHAQLLATVKALDGLGLPPIDDVVITQDQARYDVPPGSAPGVQTESASDRAERLDRFETSLAQPPLCLNNDHVGQLLAGTVCTTRPLLDALSQPGIRLPATDAGGTVFAVLAAKGTQVLAAGVGKPAVVVVRGTDLTAPSVDAAGWIWSVPSLPKASFTVGGLNRGPARVDASWLAGARVLSLRISPEGARALVVLRRGNRTQVVVAGVRRDATGRPQGLEPGALDLMPDAVSVVDAGWKDAQQVVVLAATAAVPAHIFAWQVSVGGATTLAVADPVPPDAVGLAVGVDLVDLFVRTRSGKSYARWFGGWRVIDNLHDPTLPG